MALNTQGAGVKIRGLSKSFGDIRLYDNFNFDIEGGKVTALIGPSGCGKTTMLRMLAGIEMWDGGRISSPAGRGAAPEQKGFRQPCGRTAVVFQEDRLLPWLTVRQNFRLVLDSEKTRDTEDRVNHMLDFMELVGFGDFYPHKLSGGMQRRVAIGRALLYGGNILLMDEPFKGLDEALKMNIMKTLSDQWKRNNSTVILVTHDLADAEFIADFVWEFSGSPVEARLLSKET